MEQPSVDSTAPVANSGAEKAKQGFRKELIKSPEGEVTDIRVGEGEGNTLKNYFPGNYIIDIKPHPQMPGLFTAQFDVTTHRLWITPESTAKNEDEYNLTLLHEAGHGPDEELHRETYNAMRADIYPESAIWKLSYEFYNKGPGGVTPERIEALRAELRDKLVEITPIEIDFGIAKFEQVADYLTSQDDMGKLEDYYYQQEARVKAVEYPYKAKKERGAWAQALVAIKKARARGINPYNGSLDDMNSFINGKLEEYERVYRRHVRPKSRTAFTRVKV